jgi:hypothetical protein
MFSLRISSHIVLSIILLIITKFYFTSNKIIIVTLYGLETLIFYLFITWLDNHDTSSIRKTGKR